MQCVWLCVCAWLWSYFFLRIKALFIILGQTTACHSTKHPSSSHFLLRLSTHLTHLLVLTFHWKHSPNVPVKLHFTFAWLTLWRNKLDKSCFLCRILSLSELSRLYTTLHFTMMGAQWGIGAMNYRNSVFTKQQTGFQRLAQVVMTFEWFGFVSSLSQEA